jgi:hypothetical protein
MAEYAKTSGDPHWKLYHWPSSDILPDDVIAAAKRSMSPKQYKQEFEASFETATGRIYEDYGLANHTTETIKPHEQLLWYHDFNFTPMSSGIAVRRNKDDLYLLDEIILESADTIDSAKEFVEKYKSHDNKHVIIYGDPAGKAGEKHGKESDYTQMEAVLRDNGWRFTRKVKRKHPAIKDRQNAVRAKILTADGHSSLFVNTAAAPYNHKGLATVQLQKGSTFQEDDRNEYQHITTAIGYMVDYEWSIEQPATSLKVRFAR